MDSTPSHKQQFSQIITIFQLFTYEKLPQRNLSTNIFKRAGLSQEQELVIAPSSTPSHLSISAAQVAY